MKLVKTHKLAHIKLNLTKESLKVLTADQLGSIQGGQPRTSFSCVNLCISINAC